MYAILFTLDSFALQAAYDGPDWRAAYPIIHLDLTKRGFARQSEGFYLGGDTVDAVKCVVVVQALTQKYPWFASGVNKPPQRRRHSSMRWRRTKEALQEWKEIAPLAPYRASVGSDVSWCTGQPSPWDLGAAYKAVRRGWRLLMAFEHAEVRDYFVECYRHEDIQVEPDGADEARPRQRKPSAARLLNVQEYMAGISAKGKIATYGRLQKGSEIEVERVFNNEIDRLLEQRKPLDALCLMRSMHEKCVFKTFAIDTIVRSGQWDVSAQPYDRIVPMPLTPERAAILTVWLKGHHDYEDALKALQKLEDEKLASEDPSVRDEAEKAVSNLYLRYR